MLVNGKQILNKAYKEGYAVPQFNINNLEWTKAILETCSETKSPVILGVSEGAAKYMGGFVTVVNMVKGLINDLAVTTPVIIHLDHGTSIESCKKAVDSGFTSVMYDGSHDKIEKNIEDTKTVVKYAHDNGVSVEAEVGTVGGEEDGIIGGISYASFDEVKMMSKSGIDYLAASLGSVHGFYQGEPKLDFEKMAQYSKEIDMPMVLHGGSGIDDEKIRKAIRAGQAKINVNTEIQYAFAKGIRKYIEEEKDKKSTGFDPRKIIGTYAYPMMKEVIKSKLELFGTIKKA